MAMVADALAAAGGAPGKVLTDRMGCLKGGVVAGTPINRRPWSASTIPGTCS